MNISYQPVSCSFVDYIEHFATRRVRGSIVYLSMGKKKEIYDSVKTWIIENGEEFLITSEHNEKIRLDMIIELYDISGPAHRRYSASCFSILS